MSSVNVTNAKRQERKRVIDKWTNVKRHRDGTAEGIIKLYHEFDDFISQLKLE